MRNIAQGLGSTEGSISSQRQVDFSVKKSHMVNLSSKP
jgi:hypothetical protein